MAMSYKDFFANKKIAVVGMGPHMEMVSDVIFLISLGATVTVYDMRSEPRVKHGLALLIEAGLQKYSFGTIPPEDLAANDLIIVSPDVPIAASFFDVARKAEVRIEYPQTLFLKLAPSVTVVGVLGSCGKSTVSAMIFSVLKKAFTGKNLEAKNGNGKVVKEKAGQKKQGIFNLDPDAPGALLFLKRVKAGDIVVARIPEELTWAYEEARVSPHVAVYTTLSFKKNRDTNFNILQFQTYNNFIVANDSIMDEIRENSDPKPRAKMMRTGANIVPGEWNIKYRGPYDKENAALSIRVAELFKIPMTMVRGALERWSGLKGRLEPVKKVGGIEFFNDTASTGPIATLSALRTISQQKNVILILGGAFTDDSYEELIDNIPQYVSAIILLPGSGTMRIRRGLAMIKDIPCVYAHTVEESVSLAKENARKGDRILFSPGFQVCGTDESRVARGERFVKAVKGSQ